MNVLVDKVAINRRELWNRPGQIADVRAQVALSLATDFQNYVTFKPAARQDALVAMMLDQLISWAVALQTVRSGDRGRPVRDTTRNEHFTRGSDGAMAWQRLLRGELAAIDTQYDVVSSFNVIEHVQEPTALLVQMRDRLAARGHLMLTTPNPSCIHRRLLGLQRMEHGLPATSHQPVHAHEPVRRACARWLRDSRIQHAEHVHTSPSQVRHRGPAVSQAA